MRAPVAELGRWVSFLSSPFSYSKKSPSRTTPVSTERAAPDRPGDLEDAIQRAGGGGRRLWLSPAWFREFDAALAELERRVVAAGGEVRAEPR